VSFALANVPPAEKPETVERLRDAFLDLKKRVGTVTVRASEPDAEILVDSKVVGRSPLEREVYLDPGTRRLEARMRDGRTVTASLSVMANETYTVELNVPGATAGAATGSEVAASTASPPPAPSPAPPRQRIDSDKSAVPLYIAGGVAAAGLATGIGFTVAAGGTGDRIDTLRRTVGTGGCGASPAPACMELREAVERRDTERNVSYVAFGVTGAALVAGVVYFLWPTDPPPGANIGVSFVPGGTFLAARGSF
jgi:hypothetical protein